LPYTREFWVENRHLSGEQLGKKLGIDGGSARRLIREAKADPTTADLWPKVQPNIVRGIAFYDMHHPKHDQRLWNNLLRFAEDFRPTAWVFGGDNMDMEPVSHWIGNKRRKIEGLRLCEDYESFNRDVLARVDALLPEDAERIFLLGNHEDWVEQYIDEHPEVEGFLEVRKNLNLERWDVYDYGEVAKIGKLHFIHGEYFNIHHAHKTGQVYGRNVVMGHTHTYQVHTHTVPTDVESHSAIALPCGCHLNPNYRKNKPNAWVTGFGVFYVHPNGNFDLYPVIAVNGSFIAPNGTLYE